MDYNTSRKKLFLPEYGRNIHKLIEYAETIDDIEKRNKFARMIISIMGNMNPHLRDINDFKHKLWDHLAIMSDFKLEIESPYPKPRRENFEEKPKQLPYNNNNIAFRHYGNIIKKLIKEAIDFEEGHQKQVLIGVIANHMKKTYIMWNKNSVNDEIIFENIYRLSEGKLQINRDLTLTDSKTILFKNKKKRINKKRF